MSVLFVHIEGSTKQIGPFTLRKDGVPLDLTGLTVSLVLRPSANLNYSETIGDVTIDADQVGAGRGKVYFKPDVEDLNSTYSPYNVRWKVTDVANDSIFVPNTKDPDTIEVVKP
jgi:hypothetical protein